MYYSSRLKRPISLSIMAQDTRVKQELIRRAQDYYRQSLTRAVTFT